MCVCVCVCVCVCLFVCRRQKLYLFTKSQDPVVSRSPLKAARRTLKHDSACRHTPSFIKQHTYCIFSLLMWFHHAGRCRLQRGRLSLLPVPSSFYDAHGFSNSGETKHRVRGDHTQSLQIPLPVLLLGRGMWVWSYCKCSYCGHAWTCVTVNAVWKQTFLSQK